MTSGHLNHTVLVPIVGGDISAATYVKACSLLARPDSRLVLLHIGTPNEPAGPKSAVPPTTTEPRWHRLARAVPADRTFIDAVAGDPATEIADEADRFHTDTIVY